MISLNTSARLSLVAALAAGCFAMSTPATAADLDAAPQGALFIHGVDFSSPRAVARLKRQLQRVATQICVPDSGSRMLTPRTSDEQVCYTTAMKDGLAQIDSRAEQAMRVQASTLAVSNTNISPAH